MYELNNTMALGIDSEAIRAYDRKRKVYLQKQQPPPLKPQLPQTPQKPPLNLTLESPQVRVWMTWWLITTSWMKR